MTCRLRRRKSKMYSQAKVSVSGNSSNCRSLVADVLEHISNDYLQGNRASVAQCDLQKNRGRCKSREHNTPYNLCFTQNVSQPEHEVDALCLLCCRRLGIIKLGVRDAHAITAGLGLNKAIGIIPRIQCGVAFLRKVRYQKRTSRASSWPHVSCGAPIACA